MSIYPNYNHSLRLILMGEAELTYIYGMENLPKSKTLKFDDIEKFGKLIKTSKDGFISASIQLAFYNDNWYYRTEIIDDSKPDGEEFIIKLPESLNKRIMRKE
ncbi:MAG: hypothetical protein IJA44_03595 [Clostridia bacterium]|nr:hypothetical protein [Clostridia bacterium]